MLINETKNLPIRRYARDVCLGKHEAHGVIAPAAITMESLAQARDSQTVDYSEVLPEIGCFGFYDGTIEDASLGSRPKGLWKT